METSSRLIRGAFWLGISRILVNLIGFASTVVLARLLVPEDFGLVAIGAAAASIFAAISELSLAQALIQHDDPQDEHFHTAFTMNAVRGVLLAAMIVALGWPTAAVYGDDRLVGVLAGFALANLVGGLANPCLVVFERRLEFRQWIVLSGGEKLAGFLVSALIAFLFRSYWALVIGVIASQLVRVIVSYALVSYRPYFTLGRYRELLSFSIWLTLGQVAQALNWRADPLLFGAFLPTRAVGHFNVGSRIANLAMTEVLQPVSQVLFPAFSQMKNDPLRLRAAYLRAQGTIALIALPLGLGFAVTAEPFVTLVLGPKWLEAVVVIKFWVIAATLLRISQPQPVAMATGNTRALFFLDLRTLIIRVPLLLGGLIAGPVFGVGSLFGALIGHTLSSSINALLNMHLVTRISQVTMRDQMAQLWRPALAAVVMAAGVVALLGNWAQSAAPGGEIPVLLVSISIGAAIYSAVLALLWLLAGRPSGAEAGMVAMALQYLPTARPRV